MLVIEFFDPLGLAGWLLAMETFIDPYDDFLDLVLFLSEDFSAGEFLLGTMSTWLLSLLLMWVFGVLSEDIVSLISPTLSVPLLSRHIETPSPSDKVVPIHASSLSTSYGSDV